MRDRILVKMASKENNVHQAEVELDSWSIIVCSRIQKFNAAQSIEAGIAVNTRSIHRVVYIDRCSEDSRLTYWSPVCTQLT